MKIKEFEEIVKATNNKYVIDEIIMPEGHVSRVKGFVPHGDGFRKVIWNQNGECFSPKRKRLPQFDLIINKSEYEKIHN